MMLRILFLTSLLSVVLVAQPSSAGSLSQQAKIDQLIKAKIRGFEGRVTLYAKNLDSGAIYDLSGDEPVRTASTIKLPIMIEAFSEVAEGKLDWKEPIQITADEKVSGSGIVHELSDNITLPLRDLMHLMIVVSDNTATNLILNRISGNAVNARMARLGLTQTRVMRKILGDGTDLKPKPSGITDDGAKAENKKWGIGRSSPHDMVVLVEKLYRGELVNRPASEEMLSVMKRQQYHDGIGRNLKDITIASKSGALDHLRSDVGIVYTQRGHIAMAITVDEIPEIDYSNDNPGSLLIAGISQILLDQLGN